MTTISRVWDARLGRYRNHYESELPWYMRRRETDGRDRRRARRRDQQGRTR